MKTRWNPQGAREAVDRWGDQHGEHFALRLYTARLIGHDPALALHGGGNISLKCTYRTLLGDEIDCLYVKGSGWDLATLEPEGLAGLDLTCLRRLRACQHLDDAAMANELATRRLEASAPMPSIETLLHAFLPHRFIDHSHPDAVLVVTNQPDGVERAISVLGDRVAVLPYVEPGLDLAQAVAKECARNPRLEGIVLAHHGLITFADDARTAYERHIALVDSCERSIHRQGRGRSLTHTYVVEQAPETLAALAAPLLRGALAQPTGNEDQPFALSLMEWRASDSVLDFVNSAEAESLAAAGPLTGDHLIRTKPWPMFVAQPHWSDEAQLRRQLNDAVQAYREDYARYVSAHGGSLSDVDPSPHVVLLPGAGAFCWGRTKRDACRCADITEHTLAAKALGHSIGTYTGLPDSDLFHMEYRPFQLAKLGTFRSADFPRPHGGVRRADDPESPLEEPPGRVRRADHCRLPLAGQVVVISGGAGAIGSAIAETCVEAGAHVAVADLSEERCARVVERIERRFGPGVAYSVVMDVCDETSVAKGFATVVRTYGGVDVLVPNAGIAHVASISELTAKDFRRVMEVNATGCLLFMREGIAILKAQGRGGNVIINASKNVFAPGKDFGAYSASKAAAHQLGKVAAIELAPLGIRVNMINADAIFGDRESPSGIWAEVGPQRARSRGLKPEELPDYYRNRNLLKTRVLGRHVGNAVVFFATNATPTTGATLPVDGGIVEAFPR